MTVLFPFHYTTGTLDHNIIVRTQYDVHNQLKVSRLTVTSRADRRAVRLQLCAHRRIMYLHPRGQVRPVIPSSRLFINFWSDDWCVTYRIINRAPRGLGVPGGHRRDFTYGVWRVLPRANIASGTLLTVGGSSLLKLSITIDRLAWKTAFKSRVGLDEIFISFLDWSGRIFVVLYGFISFFSHLFFRRLTTGPCWFRPKELSRSGVLYTNADGTAVQTYLPSWLFAVAADKRQTIINGLRK